MPHVPGHDSNDPNLLSRIFGWEVPGADRFQYDDWRNTRAGGPLDFLSRALIPGAETARMAQGGDASTMGLLGSTALDMLPVGGLLGGAFRGAQGLSRAAYKAPSMLNRFFGTPTPDTQFLRFGAPPVDEAGRFTTSHNWGAINPKTGIPDISERIMREPGVSAYQTLPVPSMSPEFPTRYAVKGISNPNSLAEQLGKSIQRGWFNIANQKLGPTEFGFLSNRLPHVISGQPLGKVGTDLEPLINPQSISGVQRVPMQSVIPPSQATDRLFSMYDQFGRPMTRHNVSSQSFFNPQLPLTKPVSDATIYSMYASPSTVRTTANILNREDSQPTRTPRTPTELTPRNYNPPRFQNEPQKVSGTPNPKFDRPVDMATARKKRDEDWYTPGS